MDPHPPTQPTPAAPPQAEPRRGAWMVAGLMVATVLLTASLAIGLISDPVAAVAAALVATTFVVTEVRVRPTRRGALDVAGLAAVIDAHRSSAGLTSAVAAIVVELRGIAADTLVDGPAAWAEPIAVIAQRLASADVGEGAAVARIGPHTFGIALRCPDRDAALEAAEALVALCRVPVRTPARELRIDAVAGVSHADVGDPCTGEELVRAADASLRVDGRVASPVVVHDNRLMRHARRIVAVEAEIRHSLDVDLLTVRLVPVLDVRSDEVVGLRAAHDWTSISNTEPEVLTAIADSLGLSRSLETQLLMRSMSAAGSMAPSQRRPVTATLDAHRLADPRAIGQLGLLLRVSGLEPDQLVVELDDWAAAALDHDAVRPLLDLGVGVALSLRHRGSWHGVSPALRQEVTHITVQAEDLIVTGGTDPRLDRVDDLVRMCSGDLSNVTVGGVDSVAEGLELSAVGLCRQWGRLHGGPMDSAGLTDFIAQRGR